MSQKPQILLVNKKATKVQCLRSFFSFGQVVPIGMDDVTADFYLGTGSQEKGCRRSIRDEVSTWTKAFLSSTSKRGFYCWWYFCVFCTFCGTISERAWEKEVERCKGAGCVQERIVDCWELRRFACWQFTVYRWQSQCSHWGLLASPRTRLAS